MSAYENLEYRFTDGVGQYEFPEIIGMDKCPNIDDWIEFDYAMRTKKNRERTGLHFYEYDCKFVRLWNMPDKYLPLLQQFGCLLQPDFSMFTDFPKAVQIWNKYRNHWLAAYWQSKGMKVIPNIGWSTPDNYDWQFDGYPKHSVVAVSNIGCMRDNEYKQYFMQGYQEMLKRLEPSEILMFTRTFDEFEGNVRYIRCRTVREDQV